MTTHVASAAIRPAVVLSKDTAAVALRAMQQRDVSCGGVWNATPGVWQRYDRPWTGVAGSRGTAELLGTIGVIYDKPAAGEIAFYKVTLTSAGRQLRVTEEALCDEVLGFVGLSLRTCARFDIDAVPAPGQGAPAQRQRSLTEILNTDVGKILNSDSNVGRVLNADVGKILQADVGKILQTDVRELVAGLRRQRQAPQTNA
ncbi:MAG TPA: hypothetical protein VNA14_04740 [Mycobacteriales bacterium]|nr:hypothetical protein [Mycobacteriales bacterium]